MLNDGIKFQPRPQRDVAPVPLAQPLLPIRPRAEGTGGMLTAAEIEVLRRALSGEPDAELAASFDAVERYSGLLREAIARVRRRLHELT